SASGGASAHGGPPRRGPSRAGRRSPSHSATRRPPGSHAPARPVGRPREIRMARRRSPTDPHRRSTSVSSEQPVNHDGQSRTAGSPFADRSILSPSLAVSGAKPDRNLAMELVRVTEAAAIAAGHWVGYGDKNTADGAAVDAMRAF